MLNVSAILMAISAVTSVCITGQPQAKQSQSATIAGPWARSPQKAGEPLYLIVSVGPKGQVEVLDMANGAIVISGDRRAAKGSGKVMRNGRYADVVDLETVSLKLISYGQLDVSFKREPWSGGGFNPVDFHGTYKRTGGDPGWSAQSAATVLRADRTGVLDVGPLVNAQKLTGHVYIEGIVTYKYAEGKYMTFDVSPGSPATWSLKPGTYKVHIWGAWGPGGGPLPDIERTVTITSGDRSTIK